MTDFLFAISQNWGSALLCAGVIVIILCLLLHGYKINKILNNDSQYEERYENGNIKQKGARRNIWDLGLFPALSRSFFREDWKISIAASLLVFFASLYMITKEQWFAELVKVNFGLVIGALLAKRVNEKSL